MLPTKSRAHIPSPFGRNHAPQDLVGSLDEGERWSGNTTPLGLGLGLGVGFGLVVLCCRDAAEGIWFGAGYRGIALVCLAI